MDKDTAKQMFAEALKPLQDKIDAQSKRIEKMEAEAPAQRVDASGKLVPMGNGKAIDGAPAIVRKDALGFRPYSLGRVMQAALEKDASLATLEYEVSRKLKALGYPHSHDGAVLIPMGIDYLPDSGQAAQELRAELAEAMITPAVDPGEWASVVKSYPAMAQRIAKVMDPLQDTQGGTLIPFPERGDLIELLRPALAVTQLGAQFIPLPPGGLDYPAETGRVSFAWRQMGVQADISEASPTTGSVKLSPHELSGLTKVPNSLIRFSRPAAEALVRRSLSLDAALAADLGYLEGQGGTQPLGVLFYPQSANDTPEVASAGGGAVLQKITKHVALGAATNGDVFEPEDVYAMMALVEEAQDPEGASGWLMRPLKFYNIANLRSDIGGGAQTGPFMFPVTRGLLGGDIQKQMAGLKVVTTTQVSKTRNKGTGHALTYIICANWRRMVVGVVGALELAVSTEAGFARNETWFRAILYTDSALLHPQSFVLTDTLLVGNA